MHQLSVICDCNWQGDEKRQRRCHGRTERVWFKSAVSWNDANIKAERDSYTWCLYDDDDDSPKLYTDGVEGAVRPLNCQLRVTLTREVCSVSQSHLTDIQTHRHTYTDQSMTTDYNTCTLIQTPDVKMNWFMVWPIDNTDHTLDMTVKQSVTDKQTDYQYTQLCDAMHSTSLLSQSVCLSIHPSWSSTMSKRLKISLTFFHT